LIRVDLRTVVVSPETRVWRLFPGSDYKFLETFLRGRTAFLDLPSLQLPDGELASGPDLLSRVVASLNTKDLIQQVGAEAGPILDFAAYRGSRRTAKRSRVEQAVINFYRVARQGDYVIVPSTLSERRVHVGRFASNAVSLELAPKYGRHRIPGREIQWLAHLDEGQISTPLSTSLRHQHPFSLVGRSQYVEVMAVAHPNYVFGERTVATVYNRKDDFLDSDSSLIGNLSKLAGATLQAMSTEQDLGAVTVRTLFAGVSHEFTCNQESDIHSEGFTRFISSALTPLVIIAMLSILSTVDLAGGQDAVQQQVQNIEIVNPSTPDDPCVPIVSQATKMILNSVGIESIYEMCKAAHDAKERAGLDPTAQGTWLPENQRPR
jgi:hypothetical protein